MPMSCLLHGLDATNVPTYSRFINSLQDVQILLVKINDFKYKHVNNDLLRTARRAFAPIRSENR